jgi:integrase/recombinase XerD
MPGTIERLADIIAALLAREGLDYLQTKAVFKAARQKAGLKAPKARKSSPARLSLEEELRFIDQAYARGGQLGLMMQTFTSRREKPSVKKSCRASDRSRVSSSSHRLSWSSSSSCRPSSTTP